MLSYIFLYIIRFLDLNFLLYYGYIISLVIISNKITFSLLIIFIYYFIFSSLYFCYIKSYLFIIRNWLYYIILLRNISAIILSQF